MRVTNAMVFNSSLNNIWRNARHLNNLVTQIETTQRIQRPSEDPMMANRALRYRTILSEAEQFKSNNDRGLAWMEVTESSFLNLLVGTPSNPSIFQRLHDRLLQSSSTGINHPDNQRGMIDEMRQFLYQMTRIEMNQSYMGRYVFSGFHTDEPPVLHQARPNASYVVQQTFNRRDMASALAFHRPAPPERPVVFEDTHILKLPFTHVQFPGGPPIGGGVPPFGIDCPIGTNFTIVSMTSTDAAAFNPPNGGPPYVIHHIIDTGELVLSNDAAEAFRDGTTITFQTPSEGLQAGDLNPRIYFPSWDLNDGNRHFNAAQQNIQLEVSANSHVTVNSHASNVVTDKLVAELRRLIDFADSLELTDPLVLREHYSQIYTGDDLERAISDFQAFEVSLFADALHNRIDNLIRTLSEHHMPDAQAQHTNLGSRMSRMDMIQIRLEEDEVAYTQLLSDTIDTDIAGTIARRDGAQAAFSNALLAVSRATQLSLADFINR
ncbi:MAG: hypothetical protein FWE05_05005 [Defluviitaleaceae bacterium]|nr:hypothetical protein [Defluviitaleaceae bacterium]